MNLNTNTVAKSPVMTHRRALKSLTGNSDRIKLKGLREKDPFFSRTSQRMGCAKYTQSELCTSKAWSS